MSDRFKQLAARLQTQLRSATITPTTEVALLVHANDAEGNPVEPFKIGITPLTKVTNLHKPERAAPIAMEAHRDSLLQNIHSLVASQNGNTLMHWSGGPPFPVVVTDIELMIGDDAAI